MSTSAKKCKPIGDFIEDTKFTTKNNISANGCTISDTQLPEEINILLKLNHPNIINILDVHENEHYFQMVMDHHGEMDLFEFIDLRHRFVIILICIASSTRYYNISSKYVKLVKYMNVFLEMVFLI